MKNDSVSLKRGMIGDILANFAKAAIIWIIFTIIYPQRLGYFDNTTTAFMLAISGIPSAALAGLGIAWVISRCEREDRS